MMKLYQSLISTLCVSASLFLSCGQADEIQPVISSKVVGDTLIVTNAGSKSTTPVLNVSHDMIIGDPTGNPARNFIHLYDATVAEDGSIYLLDRESSGPGGATRVMVYNQNGKFLRSWGSPGEGPTDLGRAISITTLPNGNIAIGGYTLTRVFTPRGDLVTSWRSFSADQDSGWTPSGTPHVIRYLEAFDLSFVLTRRSAGPNGGRVSFSTAILKPGGELFKLLGNLDIDDAYRRGGTAKGDRYGALISWLPALVGTATQDGNIYWGTTESMRYNRLDLNTGRYQQVTADIPGQPLKSSEIDESVQRLARGPGGEVDPSYYRWMRGLKFPDTKPCFGAIHVDETGRVWLMENLGGFVEWRRYNKEGTLVTYHIFSPEGTYLGVAEAPLDIIHITETDLYSLERENEFGFRRIHRYRISELHQ